MGPGFNPGLYIEELDEKNRCLQRRDGFNNGFYSKEIDENNKYQQCLDLFDTIKQKWNNSCRTKEWDDEYRYQDHPEKAKVKPGEMLPLKKRKKKKKDKNDKIIIRSKNFEVPQQKVIHVWNDIEGKQINRIKQANIIWPDGKRSDNKFLPSHIKKPPFKILRGVVPMPLATEPISLAEVRAIKAEEKLARKLAKKLAREKRRAARLAAELELERQSKRYCC